MPQSRRDFLVHTSLLAAASGVALRRVFAADADAVEAQTAYGAVRGVDVGGIKTFKGIPYAAPTAGANRFMPPQDPAPWTGVRDALEWGPSAPQREPGSAGASSPLAVATANLPREGEDCLVLNVWTPAVRDGGKRPVMVWCHGGGFATGSGSSRVTDGTNLARRGDVVVVSLNHRLNVLGFTYLGHLDGELAASGDVGMLDESGLLHHMGRRDTQAKIHGFRVELRSIERTMRRVPGVMDAAVTVGKTSTGQNFLAGYAERSRDAEV